MDDLWPLQGRGQPRPGGRHDDTSTRLNTDPWALLLYLCTCNATQRTHARTQEMIEADARSVEMGIQSDQSTRFNAEASSPKKSSGSSPLS